MKFNEMVNTALFWGKKNSPYILFGVGVVTLVAAVVETARATTKLEPVVDDRQFAMDDTENFYAEQENPDEKQKKADIREINRTFAIECVKIYAPAVALTGLSLACFGGSFAILNKRYTATAAALAITTEAFDRYRARVKAEENGEIKDYAYMHDLEIEEVTDTIEDENGKKKKVKKLALKGTPTGLYSYRFEKYDPSTETGATQWDSSSAYSLPYINGVIQHRQRQLEIGKYVWLSDILDDLGFGENVRHGEERVAGWAPGDLILCGLEEVGDSTNDPMTEDVMNFLYGGSNEVTLTFNPRPDLFSELYDPKNTIEHAVYPKNIA